jgi:hypothetical protein
MCAPRIIKDDERLAAALDRVLTPRGLREKAGEVGVVGAIKNAAGDIGHALVGANASRRANGARGLRPRVARRKAPANTRLERTPAPASKLTSASAAQPRAPLGSTISPVR